jgi:hypothetical protein
MPHLTLALFVSVDNYVIKYFFVGMYKIHMAKRLGGNP